MAWEHDGRRGFVTIGGVRREGFAMMRDRVRRLIAFHASPTRRAASDTSEPDSTEQFVLAEADFEPSSEESSVAPLPE